MWETVVFCLLALVAKIVLVIQYPINLIKSFRPSKKCEPITDKILLYSAKRLAEMIRNQQLTSKEVVDAYIKRIQSVNPLLNAVVADRFDLAREESEEADALVVSKKFTAEELESSKPLLGVPITVKESIAVKGMSHNAGCQKTSYYRKSAEEDADTVKLLKEAGAVILAVTNTPELCMSWESMNNVTGYTCNPYNLQKTPGGSSGGEAALISSAASVIGLGSDLGGSLRIPAHFTGIWAHKPTTGIVSVEGHYPCSLDPYWYKSFIIGPMARYFCDLQLVLNVIAKPNIRHELGLNEEVPIKNIKFYYLLEDSMYFYTNNVDIEIKNAVLKVVKHLTSAHGVEVNELPKTIFEHSHSMSYPGILDMNVELENLFQNKGDGAFEELWKFCTLRSDIMFPIIMYGVTRRIIARQPMLKDICKESNRLSEMVNAKLEKILGDDGVLLYPTQPRTAFYHGQMLTRIMDLSYCSVFNSLGYPVTNCPIGFDKVGMPIGIQVIACKKNDRLTLSVAKELDRAFGGWKAPPSSGKSPIKLEK